MDRINLLDLTALVEDLFGDFFNPAASSNFSTTSSQFLHAQVEDKDNAYMVAVEVPGAQQDQIDVQFKDTLLTVKVDYGTEGSLRKGKYEWAKKFRDADASAVEAKLNGGILSLKIPKKPEAQSQKIVIN